MAIICDGKIGPECTKANADYSKAPILTISLHGTVVTFKPEEYLYVTNRKEAIGCYFGDNEMVRG